MDLTFSLPSLYQVRCKIRACKNARNLEETQISSREVSHLSIWFCEAKKQRALPLKEVNGVQKDVLLHAESQRIK